MAFSPQLLPHSSLSFRPVKIHPTHLPKRALNSPDAAINDHPLLPSVPLKSRRKLPQFATRASPSPIDLVGPLTGVFDLIRSNPPNWKSAIVANLVIFLLGFPILVTGLSFSGIVASFALGALTWRAFGPSGFFLVACYFVIGTAATKVKMAQKEAQGVAEKRKGRRGPASVLGSSAAGCVFALFSINRTGGTAMSRLWQLGFVASFCTKLSDTVSSEIGKAYGKTTYLVTTFKVVPRGTEGAVSAEGTFAGLLAAVLLASIGCLTGQISATGVSICVLASQLANFGESLIGASIQDKDGFRWPKNLDSFATETSRVHLLLDGVASVHDWDHMTRALQYYYPRLMLNNDVVNVINISLGGFFAVVLQQIVLSWQR